MQLLSSYNEYGQFNPPAVMLNLNRMDVISILYINNMDMDVLFLWISVIVHLTSVRGLPRDIGPPGTGLMEYSGSGMSLINFTNAFSQNVSNT